jgi:hypothetical protein
MSTKYRLKPPQTRLIFQEVYGDISVDIPACDILGYLLAEYPKYWTSEVRNLATSRHKHKITAQRAPVFVGSTIGAQSIFQRCAISQTNFAAQRTRVFSGGPVATACRQESEFPCSARKREPCDTCITPSPPPDGA